MTRLIEVETTILLRNEIDDDYLTVQELIDVLTDYSDANIVSVTEYSYGLEMKIAG